MKDLPTRCFKYNRVSNNALFQNKECQWVSHNALFRNSQTHLIDVGIQDPDIPVITCIVGMLFTCPIIERIILREKTEWETAAPLVPLPFAH